MEYQVPQFIEIEDKIFGPFTLKQFIYLAGGAGLCAIIFLYLPLVFAVIVALPVGGFAAALAFYKINGKDFVQILESGFNYYINRRLYLWKREPQKEAPDVSSAPVALPQATGLTRRKLEELAWSLDVKDTGNPDKL